MQIYRKEVLIKLITFHFYDLYYLNFAGGEACNIASGGAVIGIGSDIGGSIRMPSFFNGIFGHKPSRGTVLCNNFT